MQVEESLEVQFLNTDWCNITGKTCDMYVEKICVRGKRGIFHF